MAEVTPEQAQEVLQQVQTPAAAPVRIETKTGQVFEGATEAEVLQKLTYSVENGSTRIRELGDELQQLRQQVQQQQHPQQPQQESVQDRYWKIWQTDPIAADRFAAAQRLGIPENMVDQVERQTVMQTANMSRNTAVQDFLGRCPDYPDDPNTAMLMKHQIEQVSRRMGGAPVNADIMELAYNELVRAGSVVPVDVQIDGVEDQGTIPRIGSSQHLPPMDFERQFRQLSPDQMKKAIDELQARGAR